ncbi:MAG TPA: hypothetical protein VKG79_15780 [Bryobacteraceae bacterium]|nr:hypothetical protein [Bryobacteraceae bacterium]
MQLENTDNLSIVSYITDRDGRVLLRNLVMWGRWGEASKEIQAEIAHCEKNGDHARGQDLLIHTGFIHLFAVDFSGVLAICESILPYVFTPSGIRSCHILMGCAAAALGKHDRAFEHLMKVKEEMERNPMMDDWYQRIPLQSGFLEVRLAKGELSQARDEADRFLELALATAERTYQGLAWEANARVAIKAEAWQRAEECISRALSAIEGYDVPLAAWRAHGTASDLHAHRGDNDRAGKHSELSRATILKLANSLASEDPLRAAFLTAPDVRRILEKAEAIGA